MEEVIETHFPEIPVINNRIEQPTFMNFLYHFVRTNSGIVSIFVCFACLVICLVICFGVYQRLQQAKYDAPSSPSVKQLRGLLASIKQLEDIKSDREQLLRKVLKTVRGWPEAKYFRTQQMVSQNGDDNDDHDDDGGEDEQVIESVSSLELLADEFKDLRVDHAKLAAAVARVLGSDLASGVIPTSTSVKR